MRVLLDTNVVSEAVRPQGNIRVIRRLNDSRDELFISVITIGELVKGIERLPAGRKRRDLKTWLLALERTYAQKMLDLDLDTSRIWGEITAACEQNGNVLSTADGQIAATALRHGLHLMTRNTKDFAGTGVLMINPWEE